MKTYTLEELQKIKAEWLEQGRAIVQDLSLICRMLGKRVEDEVWFTAEIFVLDTSDNIRGLYFSKMAGFDTRKQAFTNDISVVVTVGKPINDYMRERTVCRLSIERGAGSPAYKDEIFVPGYDNWFARFMANKITATQKAGAIKSSADAKEIERLRRELLMD